MCLYLLCNTKRYILIPQDFFVKYQFSNKIVFEIKKSFQNFQSLVSFFSTVFFWAFQNYLNLLSSCKVGTSLMECI